jgi:hypothetical protein
MDNKVRQMLMNELGLTREAIKEEMKLIIREEIKKHLEDVDFIHKLAKIIFDSKYSLRFDIIHSVSDTLTTIFIKEYREWRER